MPLENVNLSSISDNVLMYVTQSQESKTSMSSILTSTNVPIISSINKASASAMSEIKKQTTTMIEMRTSMSIMAEMMSVQNDLLFDYMESPTNGATAEIKVVVEHPPNPAAAELKIIIGAGPNADNLVEELSVLTQNEGGFLRVVQHFSTLGDTLQNKFSNLSGSMAQLQAMTEQANELNQASEGGSSSKGMLIAAGAMAVLGLAVMALGQALNPMTVVGIIGAMALLNVASRGFTEEAGKGMLFASAAMVVFALATKAFEFINYSALFKGVLAMGAFALAIGGLAMVTKGTDMVAMSKGLILASVAIGILALSTMLFETVTPTSIIKMGLSLFAVTIALATLGKVKGITKGAAGLLIATGAVALLSFSISMYDDVEFTSILKVGAALGVVSIAFYFMGQVAGGIIKGALTGVVMAGSLIILGYALKQISSDDIDPMKILKFGAITGALAAGYTIISLATPAILAAAVGITAIGGSMLVLTLALNQAADVKLDEESGSRFVEAVRQAGKAMNVLAWDIGIVTAGKAALVAVPMAAAIVPLALSFKLLSNTKMPSQKTVDSFGNAVRGIADTISGIGIVQLGKIGIATPMLIGMGLSTITMAKSISSFSRISENPEVIQMAVMGVDQFITGFASTMENNQGNFENMRGGIRSLVGISGLMSGVATGVQKMANLEFTESEVVNGKLVVKSTRKMTTDDFKNMGTSLGMVINALTEPLAKVGAKGSGATFSLFGYDVFAVNSNEVQQGIQALSGIGNVFNPIVNVIKTFSEHGIDATKVEAFGTLLGQLLGSITNTIHSFVLGEDSDAKLDTLERYSGITQQFFGFFGATDLSPAVTAVGQLGENLLMVKDALNEIDIDKMKLLNDIVWNTTHFEEANIEMMMKLIQELKNLMGVVAKSGGGDTVTDSSSVGDTTTNVLTEEDTGTETDVVKTDKKSASMDTSKIESLLGDLIDVFDRTVRVKVIE